MTLEEIENDIYNYYQNLTAQTKRVVGTRPIRVSNNVVVEEYTLVKIQEEGYLGQLWAAADRLVAQARRTMTADEEIYEFGVSA